MSDNIKAIDFTTYVASGKWRSSLEPASSLGVPRSVRFDEVSYEHEEYPKVLTLGTEQILVTSEDEEAAIKEAFEASKVPQAPAGSSTQSQNTQAPPRAAAPAPNAQRPAPPSQPMRPGVR